MCIAGVVGLTLGSGLSFVLRKKLPWVDPGTGQWTVDTKQKSSGRHFSNNLKIDKNTNEGLLCLFSTALTLIHHAVNALVSKMWVRIYLLFQICLTGLSMSEKRNDPKLSVKKLVQRNLHRLFEVENLNLMVYRRCRNSPRYL